jgi:hypothetical protein
MELSVNVIETTLLPSAAFVQKPPRLFKETANNWQTSRLNPKNRVERLESPASAGWRIDGCSQHGIAFNAVPLCFGPIAPNGVDVFVTDQCEDRPAVRDALDFGSAFHMSSGRVTQLGIARQLALALTDWAERLQDFRSLYENLPWGSAIQVSDNHARSPSVEDRHRAELCARTSNATGSNIRTPLVRCRHKALLASVY